MLAMVAMGDAGAVALRALPTAGLPGAPPPWQVKNLSCPQMVCTRVSADVNWQAQHPDALRMTVSAYKQE